MARGKDVFPTTLPTGAEHCPLLLSLGLPSASRPHRGSGPSKCWGGRGSWGSGQLWASPKPRCGFPFGSADVVVCYSLSGQNCFPSWHMGWTEATSLLVWEDFRETRKSRHAHRYEESEKEPCPGFSAVSDLNSDICVHPSTKVRFFSSKLYNFSPAKVSWAELAFGITWLLSFLIVCLYFPFSSSNFFLSPPSPA